MELHRRVQKIVLAGVLVAGAGAVWGQDYPTKPIRIYASTAGGGTDLAARMLAQGASPGLGQPVVVENRPAFSSIEAVSRAPSDGYTLLVMGVPVWLTQFLQDGVPWDALRDFQPITTLTRQPTFLAVHPSLPVKSVKELIALAKARPGALNYSSGGTGTSSHLAAELFKALAAVSMTRVNYSGVAQATNALMGGEVQLMFATSSAVPHTKSGRLRAIAVTSAQPSPLHQDLPTVSAVVPGYELVEILGLFAPAKTAPAITGRWNQVAARTMNTPELKEKFFNSGSEIVTSTPDEFAAAIKKDMTTLGKIIKDTRLREKANSAG